MARKPAKPAVILKGDEAQDVADFLIMLARLYDALGYVEDGNHPRNLALAILERLEGRGRK